MHKAIAVIIDWDPRHDDIELNDTITTGLTTAGYYDLFR